MKNGGYSISNVKTAAAKVRKRRKKSSVKWRLRYRKAML